MRYLLILWFVPLVLFWGWFALSAYDINFGTIFLSRQLHDLVMATYANTIGVEAADIPPMIASATVFDSILVLSLAAFRWRSMWLPDVRRFAQQLADRNS